MSTGRFVVEGSARRHEVVDLANPGKDGPTYALRSDAEAACARANEQCTPKPRPSQGSLFDRQEV